MSIDYEDPCPICRKTFVDCDHSQGDVKRHEETTQNNKLTKLIRKIVKEEIQNEINRTTLPRSFC